MSNKQIVNVGGDYEPEFKRMSLPQPHWEGDVCLSTGIWIQQLFSGVRSGRKVGQFYSQWQGSRGEYYRELSESEYLDYCDRVGCEPVTKIAEEL